MDTGWGEQGSDACESLEVRWSGNIVATETVKEPFYFRKYFLSFSSFYLKLLSCSNCELLHSFSTADTHPSCQPVTHKSRRDQRGNSFIQFCLR